MNFRFFATKLSIKKYKKKKKIIFLSCFILLFSNSSCSFKKETFEEKKANFLLDKTTKNKPTIKEKTKKKKEITQKGILLVSEEKIILESKDKNFYLKSSNFHLANFNEFEVTVTGNLSGSTIFVESIDIITLDPTISNSDEIKGALKYFHDNKKNISFSYSKKWVRTVNKDGYSFDFYIESDIIASFSLMKKNENEGILKYAKSTMAKNEMANEMANGIRVQNEENERVRFYINCENNDVAIFSFFPIENFDKVENQIEKNNFYSTINSFSLEEKDKTETEEKNKDEIKKENEKIIEKLKNDLSDLIPKNPKIGETWNIKNIKKIDDFLYVIINSEDETKKVLLSFSKIDDVIFFHREAYFNFTKGEWKITSGKNKSDEDLAELIYSTEDDLKENSDENLKDSLETSSTKKEEFLDIDIYAKKNIPNTYTLIPENWANFSLAYPAKFYWKDFGDDFKANDYIYQIGLSSQEVNKKNIEISIAIVKNNKENFDSEVQYFIKRDNATNFVIEGPQKEKETLKEIAKTIMQHKKL